MNFSMLRQRVNYAFDDAFPRGAAADVTVADVSRIAQFIAAELSHCLKVVHHQAREGLTAPFVERAPTGSGSYAAALEEERKHVGGH